MDNFRTSNYSNQLRQSRVSQADDQDPVRSLIDERVEYEQNQVQVIKAFKILVVLFVAFSIPIIYRFYVNGGINNSCGEKIGTHNFISNSFQPFFGKSSKDVCQKAVNKEMHKTDSDLIETTVETTTCGKGGKAETTEKTASDGFWSYFTLPSFGCHEFKHAQNQLAEQRPTVQMFTHLMPSYKEVSANFSELIKPFGGPSKLDPVKEEDVSKVNALFTEIINKNPIWRTQSTIKIDQATRKSVESLLEHKTITDIQLLVNDWHNSKKMFTKKIDYITLLEQTHRSASIDTKVCTDKLQLVESTLNQQNNDLSEGLRQKDKLEHLIAANHEKLNNFVNQRNSKEQEPINTVRKLDAELQSLKFKVSNSPKLKDEIELKRKSLLKAKADVQRMELDQTSEAAIESKLNMDISDSQTKIESVRRSMESLKVKIAMRKMKLELANSNAKIKEYLMSLIKTNKGEPVDFQSLFSSSENARNEIRKILKEFIGQSKGMDVEMSVTDQQLDLIIESDQQQFDEIRKIYTELVQIINQYGDFKVYIEAIATDIKALETTLGKEEKTHNELSKHIRISRQSVLSSTEKQHHLSTEIDKLRAFILFTQTWIDDRLLELESNELELGKLQKKKDLYMQQHKVV